MKTALWLTRVGPSPVCRLRLSRAPMTWSHGPAPPSGSRSSSSSSNNTEDGGRRRQSQRVKLHDYLKSGSASRVGRRHRGRRHRRRGEEEEEFEDVLSEQYMQRQRRSMAAQEEKNASASASASASAGGKGAEEVLSHEEKGELYDRWYAMAEKLLYGSSERKAMSLANASNILGQCIKLFPRKPRGYALRAKCLLFKGETDMARRDLDRAIYLRSTDPEVYYHRGVLYMQEDNMQEASQNYEQCMLLLGEVAEHINSMKSTIAAMGEEEERETVTSDMDAGSSNTALLHDMEKAHALLMARCLNNMGFLLLVDKQRIDEAVAMLKQSIELTEEYGKHGEGAVNSLSIDDRQPYYNRARAYMELEQYGKAAQDFEHFLLSRPNHLTGHLYHAQCLYEMGSFHRALEAVNQAFDIVGSDPVPENDVHARSLRKEQLYELYTLRGFCHLSLDNFTSSINDFTRAIRDNLHSYMPYVHRGAAYHTFKDYEHAISDFNEALSRYQDDPDLFWLRAQSLEAAGRFDAAVSDLSTMMSRAEKIAHERHEQGEHVEQESQNSPSLFQEKLSEKKVFSLLRKNAPDLGNIDDDGSNIMDAAVDDVHDRRRKRQSGQNISPTSQEQKTMVDDTDENIMLAAMDTKIALIRLKHFEQKRQQLTQTKNAESRRQLHTEMDQLLRGSLHHLSLAIRRDPECLIALHHRGQILSQHFNHTHKQQKRLAEKEDNDLEKFRRGSTVLHDAYDKAHADMSKVVDLTWSLLAESANDEASQQQQDTERRLRWEKLHMFALYNRGVLQYKMELFTSAAEDFGHVIDAVYRVGSQNLGVNDAFLSSAKKYHANSNLRSATPKSLFKWTWYMITGS